MKRFTFFLLLLLFLFINPVYAADSSPSADIAAKLKAFQKEAASKAAELKDLISKKLQNKAFIGSVQSQSNNSLTLATKSGSKLVSINEDTVFQSTVKSKKILKKNISTQDYIAALGDADETGVLNAKKIVLLSTPEPQIKTYFWGRIISISDKLITLRDQDLKNTAVTIPTSSKVKLNDLLILTGSQGKNNIFDAEFVYVIPESNVIKPKRVATPSATPISH